MMKLFRFMMLALFVLAIISACSDGGNTAAHSQWTWVSGSNSSNQAGSYGTKNTAATTNVPGARMNATSWVDKSGKLWLFGGNGYYDSTRSGDILNDLWNFDGSKWTWVSGSNTGSQAGIYGTKGIPAATNVPGARINAASWIDKSGNLWLFGGGGYDSTGAKGYLNDLWMFDGTNWTWVNGSSTQALATVVYGTKGIPSATNMPGRRYSAVTWTDSIGHLWLFGGFGYDSTGSEGYLNDMWMFDGTNWTWMGGSNTSNNYGNFGTKGIPASTNMPRARVNAVSWTGGDGNLWLFGGDGYEPLPAIVALNDLWKFDGNNWTWVSGSNSANQVGTYGIKGTPAATNIPGARSRAVSWADGRGRLWLFGGLGYASTDSGSQLNDLWSFDGTNWTWVSGSNIANQVNNYGTKGMPAATNLPGGRNSAVSWTDDGGNLWLFGGNAYDPALTESGIIHNDLWLYQP
ncbi:MAG: galactose oxidase [Desulfuromonadales bacterium]|nr:galactose oxidase [Desulfuromonadales bacterium]